jgi:hypothetical protein
LQQFFANVVRWLKNDGLLIITTPNKNSKWHQLFGGGWHGLGIPQYHRLVLSKRFLDVQLKIAGFEVQEMFTCAPIGVGAWRLLLASGYRLRRGWLMKVGVLPLAIAKCAFGKLAMRGEDDTICVIARKTDTTSTDIEPKSGAQNLHFGS